MTRDDIIRWAREAGYPDYVMGLCSEDGWQKTERAFGLAYAAGVAAERAKYFGPIGWMDPMDRHIRHNLNFQLTIKPRTCAPEIEVYLHIPEVEK